MGMFSTVLHVYRKPQDEVVNAIQQELQVERSFTTFDRIEISQATAKEVLDKVVFAGKGVFYLITQPIGNWTTVVELNVAITPSVYLNELTAGLSKRLDTYALSLDLHDGDLLYYKLDQQGRSLDSYSSDYQYFEAKRLKREAVLLRRHAVDPFFPILPPGKTVQALNDILNEGLWSAFDNDELHKDGGAADYDKYYVDELDRFERVGKFLEIYSKNEYPYADWYVNQDKLNFADCYLLKAAD